MATATADQVVSTEAFLELVDSAPEDVELELIRGQVRECSMTTRGPRHSAAIIRIGQALANWLDRQPDRVGVVAGGEARCRIARNPDTIVGTDVAYFEGVELVELPDGARCFDGPPVVAVEALFAERRTRRRRRTHPLLPGGGRPSSLGGRSGLLLDHGPPPRRRTRRRTGTAGLAVRG